ncbi:hypothetical protein OG21DRAFT_1510417 [Imleria badia]|nr:hypothetical protein OG21DRAFT_1510417 [Imleria badia]
MQRVDSYEFVPTSTEGAILILPQGATRHDLLPKERFRMTAIEHAFDWYEIARKRHGESIGGCSLYLITGFYKARSWSLASFHNATGTQLNTRRIKVVPRDIGESKAGRYWECTFPVDCRDGPGGNHNGSANQTVYISGFKIAVRDDVLRWWTQEPVVEPVPALRPPARPCRFVRVLKQLFGGKEGSKYRRKSGNVNHVPALTQPFHPSDTINRFLFKQVGMLILYHTKCPWIIDRILMLWWLLPTTVSG